TPDHSFCRHEGGKCQATQDAAATNGEFEDVITRYSHSYYDDSNEGFCPFMNPGDRHPLGDSLPKVSHIYDTMVTGNSQS
ncbi:MAG: hypothetical protein EA414_10660, partial [Arthrospira sp. PLM2.Bin9]